MKERIVYGETLPDAYHKALIELADYGEIAPCADWDTTQKEISLTMVVLHPLAEPMISKLFIGGPRELEQYRQEILDGILDFELERGNWHYTYHDRIFNYKIYEKQRDRYARGYDVLQLDQASFVVDELKRNPSSRRAVIQIRDVGDDVVSNDPACMQHLQYFIRDGKLECKVLFRSNDACKASFMNSFALIMLQKRIADELGVEVGSYTLRANSWHCYERDFDMLDGYVKRIEKAYGFKEDDEAGVYYVCDDYEDDWKEMMEEYQPEIAKMVEELKNRPSSLSS